MSGLRFPNTIKTLLADDEDIALRRLRNSLAAYPSIEIVGEVRDGMSAVAFINRERPDLVFLDIQMPGCNGFEVLRNLVYTPLIVFVTAYETYAVKAFEKNSLDYLLKPVEDERLAVTMQRVLNASGPHDDMLLKIGHLLRDSHPEATMRTIPVKVGAKITLVHVDDICYLEARDKYVYIHTADGGKLVDFTLAYLEERLPPVFLRIHRGIIVNTLQIREIEKYFKGTYLVVMNDAKGSKLKSAYSYSEAIRRKLLLSQ